MEIIEPAKLAFFAIYSPALGPTDESLPDQLVYYYSGKTREAQDDDEAASKDQARELQNEQLRNIGLAQGMVNFGKAFSDGDNVDYVDSEKSRIFMHELEPGWWILASVSMTQLRTTTTTKTSKGKTETKVKTEFSGREVSPPGLLLQQVLNAHFVFLLHHGTSLAEVYSRIKRAKFCAALERFWNKFVRDWDVLLHGCPAVDTFPGIKLASGGELGIGVGEEEWGSGEREVLEDFTTRTEGLIDVVVSRFDARVSQSQSLQADSEQWLGAGYSPTSADGVIYSGTNRITRKSLSHVSKWMQWIYKYGALAYGVQDNPHAAKRRRRQKSPAKPNQSLDEWPTGIPPSIVGLANKSLAKASAKADVNAKISNANATPNQGTDVLMKYMTFGLYGSGWGLPTGKASEQSDDSQQPKVESLQAAELEPPPIASKIIPQVQETLNNPVAKASFLIGLQGSLDDEGEQNTDEESDPAADKDSASKSWNNRILLRHLHVERIREGTNEEAGKDEMDTYFDRVQTIIYVNQPFIFTFLFELNTPTLGYVSFYRSIHHQLGPLQKPLLRSTSPETINHRLFEVVSPRTVSSVDSKQPIYDLIYDPNNYTVHTTIPLIPEAHNPNAEWTRLDALNVHSQIVNTHYLTRYHLSDIERTAKTSRGWWVVWMKFPLGEHRKYKEAFLVRKASDYVDEHGRKPSFGFGKDIANWGSNAGRVAEGIGIDARRYVEGLISLSR